MSGKPGYAEGARMACLIAEQLLEQAEDGTKLLAVHQYYPTGRKAIEVGFMLTVGAAAGVAWIVMLAVVVRALFAWLFA